MTVVIRGMEFSGTKEEIEWAVNKFGDITKLIYPNDSVDKEMTDLPDLPDIPPVKLPNLQINPCRPICGPARL